MRLTQSDLFHIMERTLLAIVYLTFMNFLRALSEPLRKKILSITRP